MDPRLREAKQQAESRLTKEQMNKLEWSEIAHDKIEVIGNSSLFQKEYISLEPILGNKHLYKCITYSIDKGFIVCLDTQVKVLEKKDHDRS